MIARPVTHLSPSVDAVTVRAQQAQVALVSLPITQAVVPSARAALLKRPVYVIDVQNAVIRFTASHARSAKLVYERQFPSPISRMLVLSVGVDRPVGVATGNITKAVLARVSALFARRASLPASSEIAVAPTILPGAISQPIKVGFKRLAAIAASYLNCALFHVQSIAWNVRRTKYFDIARKRIEDAQRQGDLFVEAAA